MVLTSFLRTLPVLVTLGLPSTVLDQFAEHGTMEAAPVRYLLHRYFVQKHGWYVKGLEPAGQSWNSSSPSSILKSRVPAFVQSLFEQRLHGEGMGPHEVVVFAAT